MIYQPLISDLDFRMNNIFAHAFLKGAYITLILAIFIFASFDAQARILQNQTAIDAFYLTRDGDPIWIDRNKINDEGEALYGVLKQSWQNGLNPSRYNIAEIHELLSEGRLSTRLGEEEAIQLELFLTDGYIRYVRDLSGMRINAYDMGLDPKHWRQQVSAQDALALLPANHKNIEAFLNFQEPQTATYQALKSELTRLIQTMVNGDVEPPAPITFSGLLRPGRGHENVPLLRARLNAPEVEEPDYFTYDPTLVEAVKLFQEAKGLKPDGIIGKQTLHVLNQSDYDKIKQLTVNMERLRWVADEKPNRFVVVNIPSATLWAVENGEVKIEMPVIVGRKKRQTLSFVTEIHGVRFNPTWTVPPTIKEEDIVPQLIENPGYLADKGMELYEGYDRDAPTLDPATVDWASMTDNDLHGFRMVQVAGAHNPLGRIRVLMPNRHNIYLHDTNNKSLFYRTNRAKSSGCIRMKDPEAIAEFALQNRKGWSHAKMKSVLAKSKTSDIYTPERIPVYLLYYTTWLGDEGQVVYGTDIYDHDKTLLQLIERLDAFPILDNSNINIAQISD